MPFFRRKSNYSQDYLQATETTSRPVAIGTALLTGLLVAGAVFGIFLAGRWVYNRFNSPDTRTPTISEDAINNDGTSIDNNSDQGQNNGDASSGNVSDKQNNGSGQGTGASGSGDGGNAGNSGQGQANTVPSTGAQPEPVAKPIPNTGPDPNYNY